MKGCKVPIILVACTFLDKRENECLSNSHLHINPLRGPVVLDRQNFVQQIGQMIRLASL